MFSGRHFVRSVIQPCVRWPKISAFSDLEEMMAERGMRFTGAGKAGPLLRSQSARNGYRQADRCHRRRDRTGV
jgi:transposase-like protein